MSRKNPPRDEPFRASPLAFVLPLLALALSAGPPALAQPAESQSRNYQLRANIALANSIAPEIARRYGIDQAPRNALVDVVVTRQGGGNETVPAAVDVHANSLMGQSSRVPMRAVTEAGRTSYLGVYRFTHDEVTDFEVVAKPENSGEELRVRVRERFPAE